MRRLLMACALSLPLVGCGDGATLPTNTTDAGAGNDGAAATTCTLAADTTATSTVDANGCHLLARDTSACKAARTAAGLDGFWLAFSCRVTLSATAATVEARSDGEPDYTSFYFPSSDPCYAPWPAGHANPNRIAAESLVVDFARAPDTTAGTMRGGVVGMALNGVPIFGNFAGPGDDIYNEVATFDQCGGHPQMNGQYHYHTEPPDISDDDDRFIGVMRDGYPIYGRRDPDGTLPKDLDASGGHSGVTVDSPATPVYHYHVNLQTSTASGTAGQQAWFLTTGTYRGTPGTCQGCM